LVAPFGGLAAADFAAAPGTAQPGPDVASFMPKLVWQATALKLMNYKDFLELAASV
jgi:hypothetical protein